MPPKSALLVIDVQQELFSGAAHEGDAVMARIAALADEARATGVPVIYVQHDGAEGELVAEGTPGWELHEAVRPADGDLVVHKRVSDSFHGTGLAGTLRELGVERVYVTGFATQFCVDATSRRATSEGFDVVLVSDGHTTFAELEGALPPETIIAHHNMTLSNLAYGAHRVVIQPATEVDFSAAA